MGGIVGFRVGTSETQTFSFGHESKPPKCSRQHCSKVANHTFDRFSSMLLHLVPLALMCHLRLTQRVGEDVGIFVGMLVGLMVFGGGVSVLLGESVVGGEVGPMLGDFVAGSDVGSLVGDPVIGA